MKLASRKNGTSLSIDIQSRLICAEEISIPFEMDGATQTGLLNDADDTLDTLGYADAIRAYEHKLGDGMRVRVLK